MSDPATARPPGRLLGIAILAFTVDALVYYFTIEPLTAASGKGNPGPGILAHYALRLAFASMFAVLMVRAKALPAADLGLKLRPFREDALWTLRLIAALMVLSFALMWIGVVILRVFKISLAEWPFETADGGWIAYFLCSVVAAPVVEEFVYRSLLTPALRAGYGDRGAILAGALLFYVLHLVYNKPWWMVHYFVAGAILTWAFLRRGRLWICVLLHAGGNLLVVVDDALYQYAPTIFKAIVGRLP